MVRLAAGGRLNVSADGSFTLLQKQNEQHRTKESGDFFECCIMAADG
ncbi:hypothetical protein [Bacillus sp. OV322]|nr:hypothetical protein [Bacillus sp. OV322]